MAAISYIYWLPLVLYRNMRPIPSASFMQFQGSLLFPCCSTCRPQLLCGTVQELGHVDNGTHSGREG